MSVPAPLPRPKPQGRCEVCRRNPAAAEGLCVGCILAGLAKYRLEMPAEVYAAEVEWAKGCGWL